jgi:secondary thiamine-phosphate synthase enzyme
VRTTVIEVRTGGSSRVVDLTERCRRFVAEAAGAPDGLLHVFVPHATAGIAVLETGAGSDDDLLAALEHILPRSGPDGPGGSGWRHRHGSQGHGRDHVLPAFVAPFATLPVVGGEVALGTWQSVCLVDTNVDNAVRHVRLSLLPG